MSNDLEKAHNDAVGLDKELEEMTREELKKELEKAHELVVYYQSIVDDPNCVCFQDRERLAETYHRECKAVHELQRSNLNKKNPNKYNIKLDILMFLGLWLIPTVFVLVYVYLT